MKTNPTETKKAVRFFAVTMAILLVCSIMIWGFQTAWGQVKISRIYLNSQDGTSVSSLIYVPKNGRDPCTRCSDLPRTLQPRALQ